MAEGILVLNAGSSSLKFSLYACRAEDAAPALLSSGQVEALGVAPRFIADGPDGGRLAEEAWAIGPDHAAALARLLDWIERHLGGLSLRAAGHRVVHGGRRYAGPVLIDAAVIDHLDRLIPLAPLHQGHNLAPIRALAARHPGLPQVACFDTAFHRTNGSLATRFALPRWLCDEGVQRYGFHGLSYEFIMRRMAEWAPEVARGRVVVAHLGNGASMCAIADGRSLCTTMGFTALDGLPMGTRAGQLDCGVVLYLLQEKKMTAERIETLLYRESGLLGLSGVSSDMRVLMASNDPAAGEAVDYFIYRIGRELGSLTAALGGLDALVFTAGIGEHSAPLRERVIRQAAWLGLDVDEAANGRGAGLISPPGARTSAWVIPTDEALMIALHTQTLLNASAAPDQGQPRPDGNR